MSQEKKPTHFYTTSVFPRKKSYKFETKQNKRLKYAFKYTRRFKRMKSFSRFQLQAWVSVPYFCGSKSRFIQCVMFYGLEKMLRFFRLYSETVQFN